MFYNTIVLKLIKHSCCFSPFINIHPGADQDVMKQPNMDQLEEKISRILKYMGIPDEEVRPDASFAIDFEFNEFQFNCLVYYIIHYFDISVKESDYPELSTIGHMIDFVKNKKGYFGSQGSPVKAKQRAKKAICYLP